MSGQYQTPTIMILMITALALVAVLALMNSTGGPADVWAGGTQESGGDYIVTVAQLSSGQQAVWILDARSRMIGIYQYDVSTERLELRRTLSLETILSTAR